MVKLRLRRKGRAHHAVYDIVAVNSRKKRDADFLERLGFYDPNTTPSTFKVDNDRAIYWLSVGAQPTDIVRNILSYEGVLLQRALEFKGKSKEEIDAEVAAHKEKTAKNYFRLKEQRAKRAEAKAAAAIKAQQEADAAEAKAKAEAEAKAAAEAAAEAKAKAEAEAKAAAEAAAATPAE